MSWWWSPLSPHTFCGENVISGPQESLLATLGRHLDPRLDGLYRVSDAKTQARKHPTQENCWPGEMRTCNHAN